MIILGISAFYHDSAACIIRDGLIVAAAQEERFTRKKHDASFPTNAIQSCLDIGKISLEDVDLIVFYEKPFPKFERLLETYFAFAPSGFLSFSKSMPIWLTEKLFQKNLLKSELKKISTKKIDFDKKLLFSEHHLSHAASAFFPSPFRNSAILTMDGVGEWSTTSVALGLDNQISILKEIHFPHSLGLLYSAFTYFAGFKVNSGEYKLMGLAPYGEPVYQNVIKDHLIQIASDGSFHLNMHYFDFATGLKMTNHHFSNLFEGEPRLPEAPLTQREMDLAASIQMVTNEVVLKMAKHVQIETGQKNLCLAGGVALNCVANGELARSKIFENIYVQPAAGDAGGALGAALAVHYMFEKEKRIVDNDDSMFGAYLGPQYFDNEITKILDSLGAIFQPMTENDMIDYTANALSQGKAVGWHQGRMEFGPRALGARSILADPRNPSTQRDLNLKVKFRESFRPFAPSVLREDLNKWFNLDVDSPYMLMVADVHIDKRVQLGVSTENLNGIDLLNVPKSTIPAVTHVDFSSRIQTVHKHTNIKYYKLLKKFKEITGCPVLVNTSFNVRGEPIVESPQDAYRCFMGTNLDLLVIGNVVLEKAMQPKKLFEDYSHLFELD